VFDDDGEGGFVRQLVEATKDCGDGDAEDPSHDTSTEICLTPPCLTTIRLGISVLVGGKRKPRQVKSIPRLGDGCVQHADVLEGC